ALTGPFLVHQIQQRLTNLIFALGLVLDLLGGAASVEVAFPEVGVRVYAAARLFFWVLAGSGRRRGVRDGPSASSSSELVASEEAESDNRRENELSLLSSEILACRSRTRDRRARALASTRLLADKYAFKGGWFGLLDANLKLESSDKDIQGER
ncbi:MAG: hypothetical protein BJ554DRAFT_8185, partial [Olpidium bornovanus]